MKDHLKIVMIGHVDHGKSTLIGRLLFETGMLPKEKMNEIKKISKELGKEIELAFLIDHLKEERDRNMTMDSAQLFFKSHKRNYILIDAPGHFELTKNMLTGSSQAEAALLVIDARDGIQEQTRRHAYLIKMLGIKKLIIVLNKIDLMHYEEKRVHDLELKTVEFLKNFNLSPLSIIPISAKEGENISRKSSHMPWFKGPHLMKALDAIPFHQEDNQNPLRFPVQDIYEVDGEKIIVGQVASGRVCKGQKAIHFPSLREVTLDSIVTFEDPRKKKALRGENIGLKLTPCLNIPLKIQRGDLFSDIKNHPTSVKSFTGNLFWISDVPLKLNSSLALRCATQKTMGMAKQIEHRINSETLEVVEKDAPELRQNEAGLVLFDTQDPLITDPFNFIEEMGRFTIEQNNQVVGAGIIP